MYSRQVSNGGAAGESDYAATATSEQVDYAQTPAGTGCIYDNSHVSIASIVDGTSQTFLVAERIPFPENDPFKTGVGAALCPGGTCELAETWAAENVVTTAWGINSPAITTGMGYTACGVESSHSGGANFTFADGHVTFLSETFIWRLFRR